VGTFLPRPNDLSYFTDQKSLEDVLMFMKEFSYAHQGCIYLIKKTNNAKY